MDCILFQERERANQRGVLRLAGAYLEKQDHADNHNREHGDRADDRDDKGQIKTIIASRMSWFTISSFSA